MAPSVTVKQVRTEEKTRLEAAVIASQQQLVTIDASLASATEDAAVASAAFGLLQAAESTLRQSLSSATMPADVDALEQALEANLRAQGPAAAALAVAQDEVAVRSRERVRIASGADALRGQLARADAAVALAKRDDDQIAAWRTALVGPTVSAVVATAKSPAVTTLVTNATNQLKVLLGHGDLFDLLTARLGAAAAAATELEAASNRAVDALDAVALEQSPMDGAVLATGDAFGRVRDDARNVVEQSESRLNWARSVLQSAAGADPVTPSELARITTRAAAVVASPNAAKREKDVHVARVTSIATSAALEALTLPKASLDSSYDPTTDAAIATERTAAATATTDLATKETAFKQTDKDRIDLWEVTLPPALVTLAADTVKALAVVDGLANDVDPVALEAELSSAEEDHAEAIRDANEAKQLLDLATARSAERLDAVAAAAPVAEVRLASLIRGDA